MDLECYMCVFTWATPDSVMLDRSWLHSKEKKSQ